MFKMLETEYLDGFLKPRTKQSEDRIPFLLLVLMVLGNKSLFCPSISHHSPTHLSSFYPSIIHLSRPCIQSSKYDPYNPIHPSTHPTTYHHLPTHLSHIYIHIHILPSNPVHTYIYPSTHVPIYPLAHPSIYPITHLPIHPLTHPPIYPCIHLPMHPLTYSSIHLPNQLSTNTFI